LSDESPNNPTTFLIPTFSPNEILDDFKAGLEHFAQIVAGLGGAEESKSEGA